MARYAFKSMITKFKTFHLSIFGTHRLKSIRDLNRHFPKDIQMANKYMKR